MDVSTARQVLGDFDSTDEAIQAEIDRMREIARALINGGVCNVGPLTRRDFLIRHVRRLREAAEIPAYFDDYESHDPELYRTLRRETLERRLELLAERARRHAEKEAAERREAREVSGHVN